MKRENRFALSELGQISVTVHDLERAVTFYRDVLGLRYLFQAPGMAFLDCGGVRLMLALPEKPEFDHPASILYYRVEDVHAAFDILSRRGVPFEAGPRRIAELEDHELWMAFFRDPEGNLAALMSEVPREG